MLDHMARPKSGKPILLVLVAHLIITTLTWRDLNNRPPEQVRGNKLVWRIASGANTVGSLAYLLFGRRRAAVQS
jgi:hypothetical protein